MPKERTKKSRAHVQSASLSTRNLAAESGALEQIEIGAMADVSGQEILENISAEQSGPQLSKKAKQQQKHEAWMQRVQTATQPYSKSHTRRLKRKAKESLSSDLTDMAAVVEGLQAPELQTIGQQLEDQDAMDADGVSSSARSRKKTGGQTSQLIGEGKGQPLSKAQRKRALATESARHPLVLSNPAFSANPFAAIRAHVSNTLVKHDPSASAPDA